MAEILCIVCNRMNEAGAERCWFCGAVLPAADWGLHPLEDEKESEQTPTPAAGQEEVVPEWLARIRARQRLERGEVIDGPQAEEVEQPVSEVQGLTQEPLPEPDHTDIPEDSFELEPGQVTETNDQQVEDLPVAIRDYAVAVPVEPVGDQESTNDWIVSVLEDPEADAADELTADDITGDVKPDGLPSWHTDWEIPDGDSNEEVLPASGLTPGPGQGLVVTPQQRGSVELFRLLQETPRPAQMRGDKRAVGKWLPNTLLGVALLLAILVPRLFPANAVFASTWFPREVVSTYQLISGLQPDKPVLVAADFEPAAAGELNWVSGYVLSHLMTGNIPMVTLSTNVVGTAMLQENLRKTAAVTGNYDLANNVLDLGYLPGGAIGMSAMAADWRGALPYTADFQPAWQQRLLLEVEQLSDFRTVVVLTDNAETARDWIEQVKPALGETPLLMVLTAQSAPLVQPYYESGQLNGYTAGLSGALAYSQLQQQSAVTSSGHLSFQVALIITALIILLGGLGHYALTLTSKGKNGDPS